MQDKRVEDRTAAGALFRLSISAAVVFYLGVLIGRSGALKMLAEVGCHCIAGGGV